MNKLFEVHEIPTHVLLSPQLLVTVLQAERSPRAFEGIVGVQRESPECATLAHTLFQA